ncbi:MAG: methyltransferase [Archaeoglobaceae archaeon]
MLELLQSDLKWLQESLKLSDFKTFAVISFCIRSGLFDFLREEKSVEEISEKFKYDLKATEALIQFLKYKGLLEGEGKYRITKICEILFKSKLSIAELFEDKIKEIQAWLNFENLLSGQKVNEESFFKKRVINLGKFSLLGDIKVVKLVAELEEFKRAKRLLDLGGGHGLYSYAFTLLNENLIATVFDLPKVVEEAKALISELGGERVEFVAGDFFSDPIGSGFDIIFSSFNPGGKRLELIPKIYEALNPGGVYVNRQYFPEKGFNISDLEWNLWSFEKLKKGFKRFTFEGDLSLGDYLKSLEEYGFKIMKVLNDDYYIIFAKKID